MSKVTLYGRRGWGSAIVEAQLEWLGLDYAYEAVGDLLRSAEARRALAPVNPLAQVPTLVLQNGQILTESAAITLYLADITGSEDLVPPPGSAEETFGRILARDLGAYRDEMVISTKAGYLMWPGPYGEWGSRKHLVTSVEQSAGKSARTGSDFIDALTLQRAGHCGNPCEQLPVEDEILAERLACA